LFFSFNKFTHSKARLLSIAVLTFFFLPIWAYSADSEPLFRNLSNSYEDVLVVKVLQGDTIKLEGGETVKLIGINAPAKKKSEEPVKRNEYGLVIEPEVSPITPIEDQAYEFAKELLLNKRVRLEFDHEKKDAKFTTLAYVFRVEDSLFVNVELIRQGYADLKISPPNTKYAEELREAYREARKEMRGFHGE
jgi:micrococcal nuclease